ncbi:right-handed parallel beta-helix repeat-containing protein [Streptomyces sioyaensis]|uniref:right-handed parallel beta-helix repeat-containing protein n=1 Tax=Streptomyces sioyaensis TaxID=67364 RepID=UPI003721C317
MTLTAGLTAFLTASPAHAVGFVGCSTGALNTAIGNANTNGGGIIQLSPGCDYDYTTPFSGDTAAPAITSPITVLGNGATIRRDPAATTDFRILDIANGGRAGLSRLTIKGGKFTAGDGGGILVEDGGTLRTNNTTVSDNAANRGAGIEINEGGTADIQLGTITRNQAGLAGGGIDNPGGSLTLTNSQLTDNSAGSPEVGGGGGGYDQDDGTGTIRATTISGNTSVFGGGGIDHDGGDLTVTGGEISDNTASGGGVHGGGGGIWTGSFENGAPMTVSGTTVTGNHAPNGHGGGISNLFGAQLVITGSTVTNNTAALGAGGLYNIEEGTVYLRMSTISQNTADAAPGGVYNAGTITNMLSTITLNSPTNCTPSPNPVPGCID